MSGVVLAVRGLGKRYRSVRAIEDVTVEFRAGEVHAVIGENGAGKSTLVGILSGFVEPTKGEVYLNGEPAPLGRPSECRRRGIAMVHQHFTLVQQFTVGENLALAAIGSVYQGLSMERLVEPALTINEGLGWKIDPDARIDQLPVGTQQRVEILKALAGNPEILIFDEPTAVLSEPEVEDMLALIRLLRDQGKAVILIAHKLQEVFAVANHVSVLRHGRLVASRSADSVDERDAARLMLGDLPEPVAKPQVSTTEGIEARELGVTGEHGREAVRNASFTIRKGEIVGFGGVDGNGQVELAEVLASIRRDRVGFLLWQGTEGKAPPAAYIPADRQHEGLALQLSVRENLLIGAYRRPRLRFGPILHPRKITQWARQLVDRFSVKVGNLGDPAGSLSGGNQQKVVVGRALDEAPEILVVVNPTRGLDFGAARFVHEQILQARSAGVAVALFSTDHAELASLADRILYMGGGRLFKTADEALGAPR